MPSGFRFPGGVAAPAHLRRLGAMSTTTAYDLLRDANEDCIRLGHVLDGLENRLMARERLAMVDVAKASIDAEDMNALCAQGQAALGVTMCLVVLLGADGITMWSDAGDSVQAPTDASLCQYVVASGTPLHVDDDSIFCSVTPGVDGLADVGMHSYCGEPLVLRGQTIGSFCALDAEPRVWTPEDEATVRRFSKLASERIDDALLV